MSTTFLISNPVLLILNTNGVAYDEQHRNS
jgi:hypothetical protein